MLKFVLAALCLLASANLVYSQSKIVYASSENPTGLIQVHTMNMDGSDKRQLTAMNTNCMYPRWSPDGKQIVFQTDDNRIFLIQDAAAGTITEPYFVFGGNNPSFSPDGAFIIFNSDHEITYTIYAMEPKDPEAMLVVTDGYANQQVLSNDGRYLLFSGFDEGRKKVFLADFDDTTESFVKTISENDDANLEPDMTQDAKNFVYAAFDNNLKGTIYSKINNVEKPLTKGMPSAMQPKFSPNGQTIGFVVVEGTNVSLYTMNADGSNRKETGARGNVGLYKWLDNDRIIYDAEAGAGYFVGIVNVKTGENTIIATGGNNLHPDVLK